MPLGRPILAMLLIALLSGTLVALREPAAKPGAELWTFAQTHAELYADRKPEVEKQLGTDLAVRLIPSNALNVRLVSLLMAGRGGEDLPDVVEIRQDALGRYLGPPADQVGFLPLNEFLARSQASADGSADRIVRRRLAPYTKDGQVFGLPRDVHPVTLGYRADLFAEAGVDLESPTPGHAFVTWPDFHARCLRFQQYWRSRGVENRWALDLFSANADILAALLLQRGVNLIEPVGRVRLDDPVVAETLLFYAGLVAGPGRISADSVSGGAGVWSKDLQAGVVSGLITPDWRVADLRAAAPSLEGRWKMIPLPRFTADDAPTTTWGGTMIAIPRNCRDPQRSWAMIEALYLSEPAMTAQVRKLGILPAVPGFWQTPAVAQPDPLFGGQPIMSLYASLADDIPLQHLTPDTAYATAALGYVLSQVVGELRSGADPASVAPKVRPWLAARQRDVEAQIAHGKLAVSPP